MAQFQKTYRQDLITEDIKIRQGGTIVFNADNDSNVISVDLYEDGVAYSSGGNVAGAVICPDGSTVPLTGALSGNRASVTLTGDCFAYPGQIGVGIQVISGTTKTTVLKAVYHVELFETDNPVDPGSRIALSVADLVRDINTALENIPSDYTQLKAASAPTFSAGTYKAGEFVWYDSELWQFTADHSGTWTGTDAIKTSIGADVARMADTLKEVDEAARVIVMPYNRFDRDAMETGLVTSTTGVLDTSKTNFRTSDYIAVNPGDTVYLCGKSATDTRIYSTGIMTAICWYDVNKTYIDGATYTNAVNITAQTAKYVRVSFSYSGSFGTAKIISVTLNSVPETVSEITEYEEPYESTAYAVATSAKTKADSADAKADTAISTANGADSKADSAISTANGAETTANQANAKATENATEIEKIEASLEVIEPYNRYNPDDPDIVSGLLNANTGVVGTNVNSRTSGYIEITPDDTVYLCGKSATDTRIYGTSIISAMCWYDSNKTYIDGTTYTNGYQVTAQNAKYIRISFTISGSFNTAKIVSVTLNSLPATVDEITEYVAPYFGNAYELAEQADETANSAEEKADRALEMLGGHVNPKVIDCWGDSRTEMKAIEKTSYCDYLLTKLGSAYQTTNYGISSEASGMCACRLGSNEVFVTMENDRIEASGNTNITEIYVTSGVINNFFCYSNSAGAMPCVINGVRGKIYKTTYNSYASCAFIRETAGEQVRVIPRTKIEVFDAKSKGHACIMWWGKNDMGTGGGTGQGRPNIANVYDDAVRFIGHNRFIILGETMSLTNDYDPTYTPHNLYTFVTDFNAAMAAKYPDNFIDINAWLSSTDALTSVGLTPTDNDTAFIAKNWPAYQLMVYSTDTTDMVHPNEKGREAVANRIYAWMQEKGWLA